jgi:hypothetical protein
MQNPRARKGEQRRQRGNVVIVVGGGRRQRVGRRQLGSVLIMVASHSRKNSRVRWVITVPEKVRRARSSLTSLSDRPCAETWFSRAEVRDVKGCLHWVVIIVVGVARVSVMMVVSFVFSMHTSRLHRRR